VTDTLRSNLSYTALENGQYVQVELDVAAA
jgi:hypothetical protein